MSHKRNSDDVIMKINQDIMDINEITIGTVEELLKRGMLLENLMDKSKKLSESSEEMIKRIKRNIYRDFISRIFESTKRIMIFLVGSMIYFLRMTYNMIHISIINLIMLITSLFPEEREILNRLEKNK